LAVKHHFIINPQGSFLAVYNLIAAMSTKFIVSSLPFLTIVSCLPFRTNSVFRADGRWLKKRIIKIPTLNNSRKVKPIISIGWAWDTELNFEKNRKIVNTKKKVGSDHKARSR